MKKLHAVLASVLLVLVALTGCSASLSTPKSSAQSMEDSWSSWAHQNKGYVDAASTKLNSIDGASSAAEISSLSWDAGIELTKVATSPDSGVVSGHMHSAGLDLKNASEAIDDGDMSMANYYVNDATSELRIASSGIPSEASWN